MDFAVTILGSNSAIPAYGRHPTAQVVQFDKNYFLIDCGEATQMQMSRFSIKRFKIKNIFISHMHGDHIFGLPGLISSLHLLGRADRLHIYGPEGLQEFIELILKLGGTELCYPLEFIVIDPTIQQEIFANKDLTVSTIPLKHSIPTCGFLFKEKQPKRKINVEAIEKYKLPFHLMDGFKKGEDFISKEGKRIDNNLLTIEPHHARSYAYCSDTAFVEENIDLLKGTDLLYHESTFDEQSAARAEVTLHSTAKQAATFAKRAEVKNLLLGHYSAKYSSLDHLLEEAQEVFSNSQLSIEGERYEIMRTFPPKA